ncbi:unnamed protein product, partial [Candidula unifasciata]
MCPVKGQCFKIRFDQLLIQCIFPVLSSKAISIGQLGLRSLYFLNLFRVLLGGFQDYTVYPVPQSYSIPPLYLADIKHYNSTSF